MRVKPDDYPEGHPLRVQFEAMESKDLTKQLDTAVAKRSNLFEEEDLQREIMRMARKWPLATLLEFKHWPASHPAGEAIREYPVLSEWLFHVPNGGKRNLLEAKILKGLGVMAGVHDLFFMLPICKQLPQGPHYHSGLWMELKVGDGRQSTGQKTFGKKALAVGFAADEVRSAPQFQESIIRYLTGAKPWN